MSDWERSNGGASLQSFGGDTPCPARRPHVHNLLMNLQPYALIFCMPPAVILPSAHLPRTHCRPCSHTSHLTPHTSCSCCPRVISLFPASSTAPCSPASTPFALTSQQQLAANNIFNNHGPAMLQQSVQNIDGVGFVSANFVGAGTVGGAKQTPAAGMTLCVTSP